MALGCSFLHAPSPPCHAPVQEHAPHTAKTQQSVHHSVSSLSLDGKSRRHGSQAQV